MLRLGAAPEDLAAVTVGGQAWDTPAALVEQLRRRRPLPVPPGMGGFRMPGLGHLLRWAAQPWAFDPVAAAVAFVADGRIDLLADLELAGGPLDGAWPAAELVVCAVRHHDGGSAVFDADSGVPLSHALAASCAIPGYFAPVRIDGTRYVDGGVRSPTNADVLARRGVDLAIVVAPMAGGWPGASGLEGWARQHARQKLAVERRALDRAGIPSVVLQPGPDVARRMGMALLDDDRAPDIAREAFLDAGDQLRADGVADLLAGLAARRAHPAEEAA
jgi:NTE family protein